MRIDLMVCTILPGCSVLVDASSPNCMLGLRIWLIQPWLVYIVLAVGVVGIWLLGIVCRLSLFFLGGNRTCGYEGF